MNISAKTIKKIVDFVITHADYYSDIERAELEQCALLHALYGTLLVLYDKQGISAVARWNVSPSRDTLHIIDVIIRPDLRGIKFLRYLSVQIWKLNPTTKAFYYSRIKYQKRGEHGYDLKSWLKIKDNKKVSCLQK